MLTRRDQSEQLNLMFLWLGGPRECLESSVTWRKNTCLRFGKRIGQRKIVKDWNIYVDLIPLIWLWHSSYLASYLRMREREREVFLHGVETLTFHMSVLLELDKLNRPGQFTKSGLTSFLGCGYFQTHNFFIWTLNWIFYICIPIFFVRPM